MKKIFILLLCFFLTGLQCKCYGAKISAKAAIVIKNGTSEVLFEKNSKQRLPMASTTKIMTAICVLENINPATPVIIDERSCEIEGSSVYLKPGEMITVCELLYAMLLNSGNDAATALALCICDSVSDFAILMTQTAKRIGANDTNFSNPSGLYEDEHYTTAYDLALISEYALKIPEFAKIVSTKKQTISGYSPGEVRYLSNHNRLLSSYEGCIGVKTGYTKKCGRCLVSSAERNGTALTCVTLNAPDDWNDHRKLLDYCFENHT